MILVYRSLFISTNIAIPGLWVSLFIEFRTSSICAENRNFNKQTNVTQAYSSIVNQAIITRSYLYVTIFKFDSNLKFGDFNSQVHHFHLFSPVALSCPANHDHLVLYRRERSDSIIILLSVTWTAGLAWFWINLTNQGSPTTRSLSCLVTTVSCVM